MTQLIRKTFVCFRVTVECSRLNLVNPLGLLPRRDLTVGGLTRTATSHWDDLRRYEAGEVQS